MHEFPRRSLTLGRASPFCGPATGIFAKLGTSAQQDYPATFFNIRQGRVPQRGPHGEGDPFLTKPTQKKSSYTVSGDNYDILRVAQPGRPGQ